MNLPNRKASRLENFDYSQKGAYFLTICVNERKKLLSDIIVGTGVLDCPQIQLSDYGMTADKILTQLNNFYSNISIDKYVIMPDHIHILISVLNNGQSRTPVPTDFNLKINNSNSEISKFVSTFKRFCNKEYGRNIWQARYYDHVIRGEQDYKEAYEYIENNPIKWLLTKETQGR